MKNLFHDPSRAIVVVCLFALLVATIFQISLPSHLRGTPGGEWIAIWQPTARSFMAGEGFEVQEGIPLTRFPPGFPIVLAGAFAVGDLLGLSPITSALVMNVLSHVVVVACVYLTTYNLWKTWTAGLIASVLVATYPFLLWVLRIPSTEAPYMAVFYPAWWLLWRSIIKNATSVTPYFVCGMLLGASILIRPAGILTCLLAAVTVVFALWQVQRMRSLLIALILLGGSFVIILPWEIHLYNNTQQFILLGTVGDRSVIGGLSFSTDDTDDERNIHVPPSILSFQNHLDERANEIDGYVSYASVMLDEFVKNPNIVTSYFFLKAARSWYGNDTGNLEMLGLLIQIPYLVLILLSIIAALRIGGNARIYVISTVLFVLYFWILAVTSFPLLRYLVPMFGTLFVCLPALIPSHLSGVSKSRWWQQDEFDVEPQPMTNGPPPKGNGSRSPQASEQ